MALTAVVEKDSVSKIGKSLYSVSIKFTVNDGQADIFECSASAKYNSNTADLNNIKLALIADLKEKWDKYAAETGVYDAVAFDTMVSDVQTAANGYINS